MEEKLLNTLLNYSLLEGIPRYLSNASHYDNLEINKEEKNVLVLLLLLFVLNSVSVQLSEIVLYVVYFYNTKNIYFKLHD